MFKIVAALCAGVVLSHATTATAAGIRARSQIFAAGLNARVIFAHNQERFAVGLPPLAWDNSLAKNAAAYARQLALTGRFGHSDPGARSYAGENLWMGTHGAFSIESMIASWASEKRLFAPGQFPRVSRRGSWSEVGHYTQMIWPRTQRVGCAVASTLSADYLVCRYLPAGNVYGSRVPR